MSNPSKMFEFIRLYPKLATDPGTGKVGEIYFNTTMLTLRMCTDDVPLTWQDLNLTPYLQERLGIIDYQTYEDYTSTHNFTSTDNYPKALSKLDNAVYVIQTDIAKEEVFTVGIGGQTNFTTSSITFDTNNAVPDIQVFINGVKMEPDRTASLAGPPPATGDYKKTSNNTIMFYFTVPQDAKVTIRDERTGGGSGSSVDLENITVDVKPSSSGAHSIGSVTRGWQYLFLKDSVTSQVYKLEIVSGVFMIVPVP